MVLGGGVGVVAIVSEFLMEEMSIYFPRLNICMLKRRSSFVGRIYLGRVSHLTEQSAG